MGHVSCSDSHSSIAFLSKVCPVPGRITGSSMTSLLIGQTKELGVTLLKRLMALSSRSASRSLTRVSRSLTASDRSFSANSASDMAPGMKCAATACSHAAQFSPPGLACTCSQGQKAPYNVQREAGCKSCSELWGHMQWAWLLTASQGHLTSFLHRAPYFDISAI
jgi:hypothetical protein